MSLDPLEQGARDSFDRLDEKHVRWLIFCFGALAGVVLTGVVTFLLG